MSKQCFPDIGRCVSIFDRLMKMYYDHGLSEFEIGWGQQFYVEYLYDHPRASPQEMAECIRVDKATLTKIMKKLTEIGYIRADFYNTLKAGIPPEELSLTGKTLQQMTENINQKVWHRMEEHHGK